MESEAEHVPSTSGSSIKKPASELERSVPPPVPAARTPEPEVIQKGVEIPDKQSQQQRRRSSVLIRDLTQPESVKVVNHAKQVDSGESEEDDEFRDLAGKMLTTRGMEVLIAPFFVFKGREK